MSPETQALPSHSVASAAYCAPLEGVLVELLDADGRVMLQTESDHQGNYTLPHDEVVHGASLRLSKPGFVSKILSTDQQPAKARLLEDSLIGYQDSLSLLPGETARVRVHSPAPYSASLCRHGQSKTRLLHLENLPPTSQQVPDGHFVENGLNWETSFEARIPDDAAPGIYSWLLEAPDQLPFALPFVLSTRPEARGQQSRLLVLASTNTWISYNVWGGRSRYRNFESIENQHNWDYQPSRLGQLKRGVKRTAKQVMPAPVISRLKSTLGASETAHPWMKHKMTIKRPFTNCDLELADPHTACLNHLAAGEWRLLAWLEREGIPYDMVTGFELHQDPDLLRHYRAVILSTHCEYWSSEMYQGLKRWHLEQGGWVLNLSGNSIYRQVEFYPDGSTRCTSLRFHRTCDDETQVVGVRFSDNDYGTCAPFKILRPEHWVFQGAPKTTSGLFAGASLNQNAPQVPRPFQRPGGAGRDFLDGCGGSGWETDKISPTAPKDLVLVAKGANRYGGADMVVREPSAPRGGLFSASSLTFSGCLLIDHTADRVVKNVLARALSQA